MPRTKVPNIVDPPSPEPENPQTFEEVLELTQRRPLVKERHFPSTPADHPFVRRIVQSDLAGLIRRRTSGNLAFVHNFYAYCRHEAAIFVSFRGKEPLHAMNRHTIGAHLALPVPEQDHFVHLMSEFPRDQVAQTLCLPGKGWHVPRRTEMYIRRSECRPETKPYIHLVCSNIMPTSHLTNLPKKLALCVYMLMQGISFDVSTLIFSSLREAVLTSKSTKAIVFPHLISEMFAELEIPSHPEDHPFAPAPAFIYDRIRGVPPPEPEPCIDIDELFGEGDDAPVSQAPSDDHPATPAAVSLESLSAEFQQFRIAFERERRYRRRMDALIAQSLHFELPPEEDEDSDAETSGAGPSGVGGAEEGSQEEDAATDIDSEGDSAMQGDD